MRALRGAQLGLCQLQEEVQAVLSVAGAVEELFQSSGRGWEWWPVEGLFEIQLTPFSQTEKSGEQTESPKKLGYLGSRNEV